MRAKWVYGIALATVMTALTGCGTVRNFFAEEVYEAPPAELTEFNAEFEPKVIWSTSTGAGVADDYSLNQIWINDGKVFSVDHKGVVSSHAADSGRRLWRVNLRVPVVTGIGGGQGMVLVGTQRGEVIALTPENGDILWRRTLTSEVLAPPTAANEIVAVRTADGRVTGLSANSGDVLWSHQRAVPLLSLRGVSAPVIAGNMVIAGFDNGRLVALARRDGSVIWENTLAVPSGRTELERLVDIDADPKVINDVVYAVSHQGNIAAISLGSGQNYWTREMSSRRGLDAVYGEAVYVSDDTGYVWAIQDGSGDSLWRQTRLLRRNLTAPVVAGDYVVVGDLEGYLHWISRDDGRFVARQQISRRSAIRSQPQVVDDVLYVSVTDGTVAAIEIPQAQ